MQAADSSEKTANVHVMPSPTNRTITIKNYSSAQKNFVSSFNGLSTAQVIQCGMTGQKQCGKNITA
jgi:hypothetical protein